MDRLDTLRLLLRIVERGGFAAAGRDIGISPASVSERIAALEKHYDARLLNRTTRAVHPTEEGRLLLESAQIILNEEDNIEARLRDGTGRRSGSIGLSTPEDLGRQIVVPLLDKFKTLHPEVTVDLYLSDEYVDLVASGFDFGLRLGDLKDSSLIRRKIADNRRVVCASPEYWDEWGAPSHPKELAKHRCIIMRNGLSLDNHWSFNISGSTVPIRVGGTRIANDGGIVRQWCKAGHGVAFKSIWDVGEDLASGALVEVLKDYAAPMTSLQIVHSGRRQTPRRILALMDFLFDEIEKLATTRNLCGVSQRA